MHSRARGKRNRPKSPQESSVQQTKRFPRTFSASSHGHDGTSLHKKSPTTCTSLRHSRDVELKNFAQYIFVHEQSGFCVFRRQSCPLWTNGPSCMAECAFQHRRGAGNAEAITSEQRNILSEKAILFMLLPPGQWIDPPVRAGHVIISLAPGS